MNTNKTVCVSYPRSKADEVLVTPQEYFRFLHSLRELSTHWIFCFTSFTKALNESCVVGSYPMTHTSFKKIRSHTIQNTARVLNLAVELTRYSDIAHQ